MRKTITHIEQESRKRKHDISAVDGAGMAIAFFPRLQDGIAGRVPRGNTPPMQEIPLVRNRIVRSLLFLFALTVSDFSRGAEAAADRTRKVVGAAETFLATLDAAQRKKVIYDFDDAAQRIRWSNLPVDRVGHGGLRMGDLKPGQREAVMHLLASVLSRMGYEKVVGIVESDEVLKNQSRSGAPPFGRDEYFISFLGKPSATAPWMIQFGGHHLALNITLAGEQGVLTPSLIAVQPARFTLDGKTVRPMGRETDKALELIKALTEAQRKQAILGSRMRDLVLGPGHDGEMIQPEGVKVGMFGEKQRRLLLELVAEWSGIIHDAAATAKLQEIEARLADTWFAWSGPLEAGKAYFRVQGPTVIIEYAPQSLGGDVTMHLHSMYRDPSNDYGRKFTGQ